MGVMERIGLTWEGHSKRLSVETSCTLFHLFRCWTLAPVTGMLSLCFRAILDKKLAASVNILPKASSL